MPIAIIIIAGCFIGFGTAFEFVVHTVAKSNRYGENEEKFQDYTTKPLKIYEKKYFPKKPEI